MYKIYIKKLNTTRTLYEPYMEAVQTSEDLEASQTANDEKIEYETDDLQELADKYKELLAVYTTEQLRAVQDLTAEITVEIFDN